MQSGTRTQSDIPAGRPTGDLARNRFHDHLIRLAGFQVPELPAVLVVSISRDRRESPVTAERYLILVEFGRSVRRVPKYAEGSRRDGRLVKGHVEWTQWHRAILSCCRRGSFIFRNGLHGNIIRSTCDWKYRYNLKKNATFEK